ncbi:hypothetical protein FS842_008481 [Serendipita sp. 407]|nr:hypothetical protein FS842_008481 [Serendipita sp. 407]
MHALAVTLQDRGQWDEAENMMQEVVILRQDILGPQHPRTISAISSISSIRIQRERLSGTAGGPSAL